MAKTIDAKAEHKFKVANDFRSRFYDPENGETLRSDIMSAVRSIFRGPRREIDGFREGVNATSLMLDGVSQALDSCREPDMPKRARMLDAACEKIEDAGRHEIGAVDPQHATLFDRLMNRFKSAVDDELVVVTEAMLMRLAKPRDGLSAHEIAHMASEIVDGTISEDTELYLKRTLRHSKESSIRHAIIGVAVAVSAGAGFLISSVGLVGVSITNGIQGMCGFIALYAGYQLKKFADEYGNLSAVSNLLKERKVRRTAAQNTSIHDHEIGNPIIELMS